MKGGVEPTPGWVLHVDLDQFLASVELRRHPELVGLPVIVGGNGDPTEPRKVVTCASYEAREFGVHAGMPLRSAARRCPPDWGPPFCRRIPPPTTRRPTR